MSMNLTLFTVLFLLSVLTLTGCMNSSSGNGQEAGISDEEVEEAEDYQITGILTGACEVCNYYSSSVDLESKDHIRDLLWLVPRRYDSIDGADYVEVIEKIDSLKESCDETDSYVVYTEDIPVFIRYYMESYAAPDGVNAIDHKDVILLREGDDMAVCIQSPDKEDEWNFYLVSDYGDWLLKEVELRYRISFPELFSETSASDQEENEAVEITAPEKAEVMDMDMRDSSKEISDSYPAGEVTYSTDQTEEMGNNQEEAAAQTWQSAYLEILYHLLDNLGPYYLFDGTDLRSDEDSLNQLIYLGLHDFENDGTFELIAGDTISMALFTYKDGQAEKIAHLYYPDILWCIDGVYFKDNSISLNCDGSDGSDFVNFGYLDGEYLLGLYSEPHGNGRITINDTECTYDDVNRIYTLDWDERSDEERKERIRLAYENEQWILKYQSGEESVLDSNFDFDSILWE